jgi:hypothetical protein
MRRIPLWGLCALLVATTLAGCEIERLGDVYVGSAAVPTVALLGDNGNGDPMQERLDQYVSVRLTTDLPLSDADRRIIPLLIEAADLMDEVFWDQAYGDRNTLLRRVDNPRARRFIGINYGPWDRLRGGEAFIEGYGPKPPGANFYPADATREEIETAAAADPAILDLYTLVRRDASGSLVAVPYHEAYRTQHERAAELLRQAAALAEDPGFARYLEARADALLTDDYRASDLAWLDMRDNSLDFIVGPIETYEDRLFGAKAAHEAFVLVKDRAWSQRLARYAELLPELQRGLPVPEAYKSESPGTDADLAAYDAIYYAGDANAGSKTIAINLPNDESVQLEKGTRRLQLKNAMRAKFDQILIPIAEVLIVPEQREHITFDAFFENVMFHEVAHGLGIKNLVGQEGTVREALREHASALEEGKADILGLYMVQSLNARGELGDGHELMDNYATFLASIFRSIRFGSASAHGVANLIRFNYFQEAGAFTRLPNGRYRVNPDQMRAAVDSLSERILRLQGDGDYEAVAAFVAEYGQMVPMLRGDLDRLARAHIPVDVVFEQGASVLGL